MAEPSKVRHSRPAKRERESRHELMRAAGFPLNAPLAGMTMNPLSATFALVGPYSAATSAPNAGASPSWRLATSRSASIGFLCPSTSKCQ
jgi:hypothetical protein